VQILGFQKRRKFYFFPPVDFMREMKNYPSFVKKRILGAYRGNKKPAGLATKTGF
jgi:hypothetical protein